MLQSDEAHLPGPKEKHQQAEPLHQPRIPRKPHCASVEHELASPESPGKAGLG